MPVPNVTCYTSNNVDVDESEDAIKAEPGLLHGYYVANLKSDAWRYVKLYDATVADTTVGTTTPKLTLPVPQGSAGHVTFPRPVPFFNAITVAATTGIANSDTGAPGANEVSFVAYYE